MTASESSDSSGVLSEKTIDSRKDDSLKPMSAQLEMNNTRSNNEISNENNKSSFCLALRPEVECINIDDDDDEVVIEKVQKVNDPPPAKRKRLHDESASPVPEDPKTNFGTSNVKELTETNTTSEKCSDRYTTPDREFVANSKKEAEINSYSALLDRLEDYVTNALDKNDNVERKILDVLLAAINIQVQKEPYSVRKLILDKQLVLPNTISFPPSYVVDVIIEHDADTQLSRVISKLFGDEKPKLTEADRRERQQLKNTHPAPHMTKLLMEIGQDLVQESTYSDIVHAKNLPEVPKNMETYNQVAAQLKPVWEALKAKNASFKLQVFTCQVCGFKTESRTILSIHRQTPHYFNRKYQCAMCPEFNTNEHRINMHYIEVHGLKPLPREEPISKVQCPICEEDFMYKGHRYSHLKICKRDINKIKTLQMARAPEHICMINRWLWDKPPLEPSIIAQQQQQAKQQQRSATTATVVQQQQQQLLAQQVRLKNGSGNANQATPNSNNRLPNLNNLTPQQQQQLLKLFNNSAHQLTPQLLQAAMQLRQQQQLKSALNKSSNFSPNFNSSMNVQKQLNTLQRSKSQTAFNKIGNNCLQAGKNAVSNISKTVNASGSGSANLGNSQQCEICDANMRDKENYLNHLQSVHKQLHGKTLTDIVQGPPLACSRCRDRFWTYEGLERHLVMVHGLVTSELLIKAQRKEDGGRCKLCGKQYAFNMLQHLVSDHKVKLCSAEIMYSCDVCSFRCSSYQSLETHLSDVHPKNSTSIAQ